MRRSGIGRLLIRAGRVWRLACIAAFFAMLAAPSRAQQFDLFAKSSVGLGPGFWEAPGSAEFHVFGGDRSSPWPESPETGGSDTWTDSTGADEPATAAPVRRCVLIQCVLIPVEPGPPPKKLFTTPVTLWTAAEVLIGFYDGIKGPAYYGFHPFTFYNEHFFQPWTYAGGSDKASHFVISAQAAGLLSDAYSLNRLTPNQAFILSFTTTLFAGVLVEIGDGLTPYGFSAQDLTMDAVGALCGALIRRERLEDLLGFRLGLVPTTIPPELVDDRGFSGINYSQEVYTADLKIVGLEDRLRYHSGIGRFLLLSFVFFTKGYGYEPQIASRYQEIGVELGINFPEVLKAVGVNNTTWWGDTLLRVFDFIRIPFTQIGVYYNLANQKWYGPSAPYQFY